jgi:hypothetical protein
MSVKKSPNLKKPVKIILVSVHVKAIEVGYYNNQIIPVGTEFIYKGGLNRAGGLPLWVEPIDKKEAEKIVAEAKAKAALEDKKDAAPALNDNQAVAPLAIIPPPVVQPQGKALTKAELITKLSAAGQDINVLNKMLVADLRALDMQLSQPKQEIIA